MLEMPISTTCTNEHGNAERTQKEVANNRAVSKLSTKNKYPFARAFLNAQADLNSKSSSLPDSFKEYFLIESQLTDQISSRIPLHRQLNTSLVHSPNLCQIQAAFTCSFFCQQVYLSMKTSGSSKAAVSPLTYLILLPTYTVIQQQQS